MTTDRIRLGVSTCLLGKRVRYDGGHKLDRFLVEILGPRVEWIPVCPEVECGLPIPREPMQLMGDPRHPRLVTLQGGADLTERLADWAQGRLDALEAEALAGFVFKSRSPSCGLQAVSAAREDGTPASVPCAGLWARAVLDRFPHLPVADEELLHDAIQRMDFLERVLPGGSSRRRL